MSNKTLVDPIRAYLRDMQHRFCAALEAEDGSATFSHETVRSAVGVSHPRVLCDGPIIERAAVHFTHTAGARLPAAARPDIAGFGGHPFEAVSVSTIVHPRNPYAPTMHANLRLFVVNGPGEQPVWWFGGGFDLTPYYGFEEDAIEWHQAAFDACAPSGPDHYARFKKECDEYFVQHHRDGEARGIGGLFFDLYDQDGFEASLAFVKRVGEAFVQTYPRILERRKGMPYGERERDWQTLRRGRYVEFNLLHDRGTKFGLAVGGRTERVLASMPPLVSWAYCHEPEPGSPEAALLTDFLPPRDWLPSQA